MGDSKISGKPVSNQCATTLAKAVIGKGCAVNINCSREPSIKSSRNKRSKESNAESNAATHAIPGAIRESNFGSGPITSGNKVITSKKNHSGFKISAFLRIAI